MAISSDSISPSAVAKDTDRGWRLDRNQSVGGNIDAAVALAIDRAGQKVVEGRSYCPLHSRSRKRSPSSKRTGTRAWRKVRAECLLRDGNRCVKCGATERLEAIM